MIVMKFGGSSVADSARIRNVADIVRKSRGKNPAVVVSALGGTTDMLIKIAKLSPKKRHEAEMQKLREKHLKVIRELGIRESVISGELEGLERLTRMVNSLTPKISDHIASFGERMSARIVAGYMSSIGMKAKAFDAYEIGMVTDSNFGFADVLPETYSNVKRSLPRNCIPVITGFIGKDRRGEITTIGRGGSDYTASIIGAAIGAEEIQIWTNVNGIMSADPRIVKSAHNIRDMSYEEESELEFLGSPTLHLKGIIPAVENKITVRILNTLNPGQRGTVITQNIDAGRRVASITHKEKMCIINIYNPGLLFEKNVSGSVSEALQRRKVSAEIISISKSNVMILLNESQNKDISGVAKELKGMGSVEIKHRLAKVSIVGKSVAAIPGISQRMLSAVRSMPVEAALCSGSETSQSFIVKERDAKGAVRLLHKEFFGA